MAEYLLGMRRKITIISRKGVVDKFCIPNLLTAAIMSGKPLMLEHYMVNYKEEYERAVMNPNHRKAFGRAIAGTGELMSIYIKEEHRELLKYVTPMQIINAGNAELLSATGNYYTGEYEEAFIAFSENLDLVTPYDSVPGFPRGYRLGMEVTDREMFEFFFDRADSWAVQVQIKGILKQKDYDNTAKAEEKRHCCGAELFNQSGCGGADARSESTNRKRELRKLYEELNSKWKEEVQKVYGETNDFWSNQDRECVVDGEKTADCDGEAKWSPDRIIDEIFFDDREN